MNLRLLTAAFLVGMSAGQAGQILVGTTNTGNASAPFGNSGGLFFNGEVAQPFYGNVAFAQAFTLSQSVTATDVSVFVGDFSIAGTFTVQITDSIGPGTQTADVLFSGSGALPGAFSSVNIAIGSLNLNPGNYFLVLSSGTAVPAVSSDGSNCGGLPPAGQNKSCFETGRWVWNGANVSTAGSLGSLFEGLDTNANAPDSPAPPLTDFFTNQPISLGQTPALADFQLNGVVTPEPSTLGLVTVAGLFLAGRRRVRKTPPTT